MPAAIHMLFNSKPTTPVPVYSRPRNVYLRIAHLTNAYFFICMRTKFQILKRNASLAEHVKDRYLLASKIFAGRDIIIYCSDCSILFRRALSFIKFFVRYMYSNSSSRPVQGTAVLYVNAVAVLYSTADDMLYGYRYLITRFTVAVTWTMTKINFYFECNNAFHCGYMYGLV